VHAVRSTFGDADGVDRKMSLRERDDAFEMGARVNNLVQGHGALPSPPWPKTWNPTYISLLRENELLATRAVKGGIFSNWPIPGANLPGPDARV